MLGKLTKYEFKHTYSLQGGLAILVLIISVVSMITRIVSGEMPDNMAITMLKGFSFTMSIIARISMVIITFVIAVLRYRRTMLKDEGYLMHTLPVKEWQLLLSKMIVPIVWMIFDAFVIWLSIAIELRDFKFFNQFIVESGISQMGAGTIALLIACVFIGLISSFTTFYTCLNIGHSFSKDKDLFSFVSYIAMYIINQVVSSIALTIVMIGNNEMFTNPDAAVPGDWFNSIFLISAILSIVMIIAYNGVSLYLLNKKLNLE